MCRAMKSFDVIIVGGGVVGSACAYYLKKHGFSGSIGIIEKDVSYQNGCTARSAGGIRQQFSTPENIELSKFGLKLIRNLKAEFGPEAEVNFREQGYLILASADGLPILEENHRTQLAIESFTILFCSIEACCILLLYQKKPKNKIPSNTKPIMVFLSVFILFF